MKDINFLTVLAVLQFLNLMYIKYNQPKIGVDTADIIWCIYFYSNLIIFFILMCSDVIYTKIK